MPVRLLWTDERGFAVSTELTLLATVLFIGVVVGLATVRDQVVQELGDFSASVSDVDQSYSYTGIAGHTARVGGSNYLDSLDHCDLADSQQSDSSSCIVVTLPSSDEGDGGPGDGPGGGGDGDPHTQGYWKNHPEDWPTDSLSLGNESYSQEELLDILETPPAGDASLILAHQLIAAKLNEANGVDASSVADTIDAADALLSQPGRLPYNTPPDTGTGQAMVEASEILDAFNNGN